ncbi:stabilizer of axonemal microtubules 2-like [Hydractinia symbiolongicarpus]|uniref:stabilizer of axonemal microtubules 2-like n=1 Tax=Hydractinia symbiolongicarpus TaxID=13093 RepID=UPI00254FF43F|nr:stabilizer of axonemal microtubules 2-like [Hydractinia symbiolongicarpus]XP_057293465.1 stabilizer of axonemal microtubules 2-like [Hydractinia symbiolongicarpus]XP_057293466.1 stabilizer of axonemal microtubules 2-like [Hydractinia symbiolongicarpus]XP_057293467.1 stabilizer of axonemal microtubules 2-like [Hydractinia symbiolongicarpus]XP_057293468.1 stabilizer of axonemal microtubules 2-like [Hydractinia symbiolongicarpus]XP_057293469.1 stabilizer of axonemal microtubules 2-like [Hydrac
MAKFEWDKETIELLREKGLRCICQLCDCGRPHRHPYCRKQYPNVTYSFQQNRNNNMETSYQSRFNDFHNIDPPKSMKPVEKQRDPNPPPMDFRTENKMAFKPHNATGKEKPCKLEAELAKLNAGNFDGNTVYNETYIGHQPVHVNPLRPKTVFKPEKGHFATETEYSKGYQKKIKIPQQSFREKPASTYGLLYPDPKPTAKNSVKNSIHDGRTGPRAELCAVKESNVHLGLDDDFNHITTNSLQFQKYDNIGKLKSMKPTQPIKPRTKFTAISQSKVDYGYDENDALKARAEKCQEYPSLLRLSMDEPADFRTVNRTSYNSWKPEDFNSVVTKASNTYVPPTEQFDGISQTKADFKSYGIKPRVGMLRPIEARKSSGKMVDKSSYTLQYPHHGNVERKIYGDQHEDNLYLPPKSAKFDDATVMRSDFTKRSAEKQKAFKPEYTLQNYGGEFSTETEYRKKYQKKEFEPCAFSKFLAEVEARRDARLNRTVGSGVCS